MYREAWPKTDIGSPEADSLLRIKFIDGVLGVDLQKYLRLHAASDDFAATVSKARHFVDASEVSWVPRKPALWATSPIVNYPSFIDGVREVVESALHDRGRQAQVNAIQAPAFNAKSGSRGRKTHPRQGSPASAMLRRELPAVRHQVTAQYDSRYRGMISLDNSPMVHLVVVDGRITSRFVREVATAPGHGVIVSQKVKASRVLSPLRRAGRLARAAHIFRRRSLRISRGQGKGARAIDPRPGLTTTTTGGQDGGRRLASHSTSRCRSNSSPLRDSVDGVLDRRTNNLPVSPVRHGPSAAVAMCVATLSATQGVIRRALSPRRQRQLCLVKCVASLVAMRLAMEEMLVRCHLLFLLRP